MLSNLESEKMPAVAGRINCWQCSLHKNADNFESEKNAEQKITGFFSS